MRVEVVIDVKGGAVRRALEDHVFQEVRYAGLGHVSSREPVLTKKPTAAECAEGLVSATMVRPLGRTRLMEGHRWFPAFSFSARSEESAACAEQCGG